MKLHSIVDVITNSSSSVFIVGFDGKPETPSDLKEIMFPNEEEDVVLYEDYISTSIISEIVWRDLSFAEQIFGKEKFFDIMEIFGVDEEKAKTKWEELKGRILFQFSYGSEVDSSPGSIIGSFMENADIFTNLPHIKICSH